MYVNISNCYHCNLFYMVNHYVRGCRVTTPPPRNRLAWRYFMKLHLYMHCLHCAMMNVSGE